MDRIAIIGMGLIGTSLGLSIKKAGGKAVHILGTDINRGHASKAQKMGAIDQVASGLATAVEDAELVIVATPVIAMKDVMEIIGPYLMEGCLVTDTGSSKGVVIEWAEQYLPPGVNFVGGDPMVSKAGKGPEAADAYLFQNRPYCLIPAKSAGKDSVRLMLDMIRAVGANHYFMDVAEHDSFVAAVSHLPFLISVALVGCTSKSPSWDDIAKMASIGYGDVTSLAVGEPSTSTGPYYGDNQGIVYWIDSFIREMQEIRRIVASNEDGKLQELEKVFSQAFEERNRWLAGVVTPAAQEALNMQRGPDTTVGLSDFFLGDTGRRLMGWGTKRDRNFKDKK